jgi:siroheme synthase-like protein
MSQFPILIELSGLPVCVIGGGEVAFRKVRDCLAAQARVTLIAPAIHDSIRGLCATHAGLVLRERQYQSGDLEGARLVFCATDDPAINQRVFEEARSSGTLINVADDPQRCSFFVPSWTDRGGLILAVSTSGASPALAGKIRRELEQHLPQDAPGCIKALREARRLVQEHPAFSHLDSPSRGELLKELIEEGSLRRLMEAQARGAEALLDLLLNFLKQ